MNKLLCKYFDPDKKGYVTIGDVTIKIMQYLICIIITTFILYSMYISAAYPILYDANTTIVEFLSDIVGSIAWIIIIIIIGLFIVGKYLLEPFFHQVSKTRSSEIFVSSILQFKLL